MNRKKIVRLTGLLLLPAQVDHYNTEPDDEEEGNGHYGELRNFDGLRGVAEQNMADTVFFHSAACAEVIIGPKCTGIGEGRHVVNVFVRTIGCFHYHALDRQLRTPGESNLPASTFGLELADCDIFPC